jgi:hypothetical protein
VGGPTEDVLARAGLDDPAGVHHGHPVGEAVDDGEVVGHIDERGPGLARELTKDVEDARLGRHVESGGRLVQDDDERLRRERHRDRDPLLLAAGQLERVPAEERLVGRQTDARRELADDGVGDRGLRPVDEQRLGDLLSDSVARVQTRTRVLRDVRDACPANAPKRRGREAQQVVAREHDRAARDPRPRTRMAEESEGGTRLSASGLAHEADDLAGMDVERDLVQDLGPVVGLDPQVGDREYGSPFRHCGRRSSARRSARSRRRRG